MGGWLWRGSVVVLVLALIVLVGPAAAQTTAEADDLNALVTRLYQAGKYAEAIPLAQQVLDLDEKALGAEHPDVAASLNRLAELYRAQGRYAEAEPLYKRTITIFEKALGPEHPHVGTSLNNLAEQYRAQGRYAEAEPLYKRDLAISEKALGAEHPSVATSLNNLTLLYQAQGRYAEAEPLYKRTITIFEKALGPEHPSVATSLNNLAELYRVQGRYAGAEPLYKRSLAMREKALGAEHPDVATSLNNLTLLYQSQGRYTEAEPLYKRTITIFEKALGPEHPSVAKSLNNLAALLLSQNDLAGAAEAWQRATVLLTRWAERGVGGAAGAPSEGNKGEAQQNSHYFSGLVKTTQRLAATGRESRREGLTRHAIAMFETAQWGQGSAAAASLAQMAARSAGRLPGLAALVRERQDLVVEWQVKDKHFVAAKSEPPAIRNASAEKTLSDRLAAIDGRLAAISSRFANDFPEYSALASPKPSSVAVVQASLRDDEALVLFLDTDARFKPLPEETFVWVVTKREVRWVRSELGTADLAREVAALRCGLDAAAWRGNGVARCRELWQGEPSFGAEGRVTPGSLPFDTVRAHALYKGLFGEVEDMIKGKHLLLVPSGPLTTLPFHVLVTEPPKPGALHRDIAWLAKSHATTVGPAVSSLKALRREAKPVNDARRPFVGFGSPNLVGASGKSALSNVDTCSEAAAVDKITLAVLGGPPRTLGAGASLEDVRRLDPVPGTATLLCNVAQRLGVPESEIHLGSKATEATVKKLSDAGTLKDYRIIHFATHGLVSGELKALAEPALVLTPPPAGTTDAALLDQDNGLLTASEVATLKLDADWVVLSACNTAGPSGQGNDAVGAEALSGLARAFFYAGTRALLVSHWHVYESAAERLATAAFEKQGVGRAEAIRQAMLSVLRDGKPDEAHPSYWAPFVVVGEGSLPKNAPLRLDPR